MLLGAGIVAFRVRHQKHVRAERITLDFERPEKSARDFVVNRRQRENSDPETGDDHASYFLEIGALPADPFAETEALAEDRHGLEAHAFGGAGKGNK